MIYTIVDGKIVPYKDQSGKRYDTRSKAQKQRHTKHTKDHNKFYDSFYNTNKWHKLSRQVRKAEPLCRMCVNEYHEGKRKLQNVNIATSVDHIVKLSDDWSRRFDVTNLEPLCDGHHAMKDGNRFKGSPTKPVTSRLTNTRGLSKYHE